MADVTVIIPIFNGQKWIEPCMHSIASQSVFNNLEFKLEIVVYNDGSTDGTLDILFKWAKYFTNRNVPFDIINAASTKGVGAAKNGAVQQCNGTYLCFQDIDDVMHPDRNLLQWKAAKYSCNNNCLIGSKVTRDPPNSTPRFTKWANNLSQEQLKVQIYTSNGPTLLMPTWFCHRSVYDKVGGFDETGQGTPEDLIFFYKHLDNGGELHRVDEELLIYTYHEGATTFCISRKRIWDIQLERLEMHVLSKWNHFTIWNAGKLGRKVVRALKPDSLKRVKAFCDVDKNKIGRTIELYCPTKRGVLSHVPVIHFTEAKPPLLICVKLDMTNGDFEKNLSCMNLSEGADYVLFN